MANPYNKSEKSTPGEYSFASNCPAIKPSICRESASLKDHFPSYNPHYPVKSPKVSVAKPYNKSLKLISGEYSFASLCPAMEPTICHDSSLLKDHFSSYNPRDLINSRKVSMAKP